jgi:hypothetical protein
LKLKHLTLPLDNATMDFCLNDHEHLGRLVEAAMNEQVQAIFVDSLRGAMRGDEDDSGVNDTVKRLAELARDVKKPVFLTHHLRKRGLMDGDGVSLDRVRGSSAIVQTPRMVWALDAPDANQPQRKRLSVIKSNVSVPGEPVGLWMSDGGVQFGDAPVKPEAETQMGRAKALVKELLANGRPRASWWRKGRRRRGSV